MPGIFDSLRTAFTFPRPSHVSGVFPSDVALTELVISDLLPAEALTPVTRSAAMSIPSVRKARDLITTTVARLPIKVQNKDGILETQPAWTYRTDSIVSPFQRMLWTLDDLLFYDASLWLVSRGSDGFPVTAERVPYEWWSVRDGMTYVNNVAADPKSLIFFGRIHDGGLLDHGATQIRAARRVDQAVAARAASPIPLIDIHLADDSELTKAEKKELATEYNKARREPDGAVVVTPSGVELKPLGADVDNGYLTEARNGVRLDVANLTGVPVALLDGSTSTASLTYSTAEGRRNEFLDYSLSLWIEAIQGRLSQDDVVPRGQSVVFDQTDFLTNLPSPTGLPKDD